MQRAIATELDRGGQVYYVHNRIESIYAVARALEKLVPKARIAVGHGKMTEPELEPVMAKFIEGDVDVFVSTTIIENGIDIPNVNTIIVNDADKFGLAQLYQLRGRVGRSNHQAYAYLLYQAHKALPKTPRPGSKRSASSRISGAGLQIAMRDLEIRGAGNLLGAAQSGFIGAVGFETYVQLLAEAIAERRGIAKREATREAVIDVKLDAFIPNDYIPQVSQKIAVYQQLAARADSGSQRGRGQRSRPFRTLPEQLEIWSRSPSCASSRCAKASRASSSTSSGSRWASERHFPSIRRSCPSCNRSPVTNSAFTKAKSSSTCRNANRSNKSQPCANCSTFCSSYGV